jgi:hypothetical protein
MFKESYVGLSKICRKRTNFLICWYQEACLKFNLACSSVQSKVFLCKYTASLWLGGMLTNWKTILKSISKIRPILKEKQRIISALLSKRDEIKRRLINKILTAMKFIQKGRQFLEAIKTNNNFLVRNRAFFTKRKELVNKKKQLLLKRKQLLKKLSDWEMTSPRLKGQPWLSYQLHLRTDLNHNFGSLAP